MASYKTLLAALYIAGVGAQATQTVNAASSGTSASACASTIAPRNGQPSVAPGYQVNVVASGLTEPRGIIFDSEGNLLVVQQGKGVSRLRLTNDEGPCIRVDGQVEDIIDDDDFNHGIELSADGRTLYASTPEAVYSWNYDASQGRNTSGPREVIGQMGETDGHVTRTLLLSRRVEGMLLVSRGSMSNLDPAALDVASGVSTIKAFNVSSTNASSYRFADQGTLLGWGLRNSVGVAEHPVTGGIFSVENSVDNFQRNGVNIHQNNPAEELNFHGYLNGTQSPEQGRNFGYPSCYSAWNITEIPQNNGINVGVQFAIGNQNDTVNDLFCQRDRQGPRLAFPAHTAPLDIKFNSNGTAAWVSFHGSWNRDDPIGYKLSVIPFASGQPTEPSTSTTAAIDIVSNPDLSRCPRGCFRPVGLAFDSRGRLFMTSDSTGEIYVVTRTDGGSVNEASPANGLPNPSPSASGVAPSSSPVPGVGVEAFGENKVGRFALAWAAVMALLFV